MTAPSPTVLFDVMGTLVYDPFYAEIPAYFGMSLDALIACKHPTAWVEFERGEIDEAELGRRFFADGRAFDLAGLKAAMRSAYRWLDGMHDLVASLHAAGVAMHVLSNYPPWYAMIEQRLSVSRYMPWTFVSCHTGLRKPDAAAYAHVQRTLDVPLSQCVFVDDRADNCDGARSVGLNAVQFTDAHALREALAGHGVVV